MTTATVRIHAYKLSVNGVGESIQQRLMRIASDPLDSRQRRIIQSEIRLDEARKGKIIGKFALERTFLDFVRLRDVHGPGRVSASTKVEGFDMGPDDYFGEETAAVFLPGTNHLLVQFNHFGPKAQGIADYLSSYGGSGPAQTFEIAPVLDPAAKARFGKLTQIRRFEIGVDLTKMSAQDRANGMSLYQVTRVGEDAGGARMRVSISVGHDADRSLGNVVRGWISNITNNSSGSVTSAIVAGRASSDGEIEVIDLIEQKLTYEVDLPVQPDRRISQSHRWQALMKAWTDWKQLLK